MQLLFMFPVLLAVLSFVFQPVSAYRFGVGDGLALVLFIIIGIIAVCALLGWIARKRAGR